MEFGGSLRRARNKPTLTPQKGYSCSLQLYTTPPQGEVALADFDAMAVERLQILRAIERHNLGSSVRGSEEWLSKIYDEFNKAKNFIVSSEKISSAKAAEAEEARRRDHVSHFILRLAYCRTEDLRRWFVTQEVDLFRARFLHTANSRSEVAAFMRDNNISFTSISPEEFHEERENLLHGTFRIASGDQLEGRTFYKVVFTSALELVRSRKVFLKAGFAYVPDTELVTLIAASYRTSLSKELAQTSRALPQLEDDERLQKLLHDFNLRHTGTDFSSTKANVDRITPAMLDTLAAKAFPPCMRGLHDTLNACHHLKHGGRMQYGLFLKAAGLTLEDALHFWRSHFTKNMDVDKFDREYAYNIRHNYGKEGKRTNYSPYSCIKIICGSVGPGDAHGCPFKLTSAPLLRQRLAAYGVNSSGVSEIADLASKGHYQIACQRYWEAAHKAPLEGGINHPNQYLEESRKLAAAGGPQASYVSKSSQVVTTRRVVLQQSQLSQASQLLTSSVGASQTPVSSSAESTKSIQQVTKSSSLDFEFEDDDEMMDFASVDASIEQHNRINGNSKNEKENDKTEAVDS